MGAVRLKSQDENRFLYARSGDSLHFSFQCDLCWFRNLQNIYPNPHSLSDDRLLLFIRHVNLDGMWSREASTVRSIRYNLNKFIKACLELGMTPNIPEPGSWPVADGVGFQIALAQLQLSLSPGNNQPTHLQYDTIRKIRTSWSH